MTRTLSRGAAWSRSALPVAAKALVALVAVEFLLLRVVNRMSGAFPPWMRGDVTSDLVLVGTFAYNGAYLLGLLLIGLVAVLLLWRDLALSLLLLVLVPAVFAAQAFGGGSPAVVALAGILAGAAMIAVVLRIVRHPGPEPRSPADRRLPFLGSRSAFVLFVLAALGTGIVAIYAHAGDALANVGVSPPGRAEAYSAGEVFAVLAAFLAFAAFWARPGPRNVGLAASGAAAFTAPVFFRPELIPLIAYWSTGFRLDLPFPLYVAALAAFLYAIGTLWGSPQGNPYGLYALVLLGLAGRQLADFYAVLIVLVALVFLTMGYALPAPRGVPSPVVLADRDEASGRRHRGRLEDVAHQSRPPVRPTDADGCRSAVNGVQSELSRD